VLTQQSGKFPEGSAIYHRPELPDAAGVLCQSYTITLAENVRLIRCCKDELYMPVSRIWWTGLHSDLMEMLLGIASWNLLAYCAKNTKTLSNITKPLLLVVCGTNPRWHRPSSKICSPLLCTWSGKNSATRTYCWSSNFPALLACYSPGGVLASQLLSRVTTCRELRWAVKTTEEGSGVILRQFWKDYAI